MRRSQLDRLLIWVGSGRGLVLRQLQLLGDGIFTSCQWRDFSGDTLTSSSLLCTLREGLAANVTRWSRRLFNNLNIACTWVVESDTISFAKHEGCHRRRLRPFECLTYSLGCRHLADHAFDIHRHSLVMYQTRWQLRRYVHPVSCKVQFMVAVSCINCLRVYYPLCIGSDFFNGIYRCFIHFVSVFTSMTPMLFISKDRDVAKTLHPLDDLTIVWSRNTNVTTSLYFGSTNKFDLGHARCLSLYPSSYMS